MEVGQRTRVKAHKADGTCYRSWLATVEAVEEDRVVLVTPPHHRVEDVDGPFTSPYAIRSHYWPKRRYSLLEVYTPDGTLEEIYVDINSPVEIRDTEMSFTDHELDVSRVPPQRARIVDEDEFREAASRYAYSIEFQRACYEVARAAVAVANGWEPGGRPEIAVQGDEEDEEVVP